jgi:pimeloyl-ACP methyl ester carboxylesterase
VLWLRGTADEVYSVANAQDEIKLFVNSAHADLRVAEGGQHFLSASDPGYVNSAAVEFIDRWK